MTSLAGIAKGTDKADQQFMQKVNNLLQLSTFSDGALKLPIHISSIIWSNKQLLEREIHTLTECTEVDERAEQCAKRIVESTPTWLLGPNPNAAIKDILTLFTKSGSPFMAEPQGV